MKNKLKLLVFITATLYSTSAFAQHTTLWNHNGSVMSWYEVKGKHIQIQYLQPRPNLYSYNVVSGTLLFQGTMINKIITGIAYVFSEMCPPVGYQVSEIPNPNNPTQIILQGPAPIINGYDCSILDYTLESPNAVLMFQYIGEK